jgi:hypothetical protein
MLLRLHEGDGEPGRPELRMVAIQPVLAGRKNVDIACGPVDKIPVAVFNLGPARTVEVTVTVRNVQRAEVAWGVLVAPSHHNSMPPP